MKFEKVYLLVFLFVGTKSESISQNKEIHSYFNYVVPLVKKAGQVILEAKNIEIEVKSKDYDLVTKYDRKIENILIKEIREKYPSHKFIGEEESSAKHFVSNLTNKPTWFVDPIDGTANFVRSLPISCISLGLTINKTLVMGIVYNPYTDELYTAFKGEGAFMNGERIRVSGRTDIKKSLMGYELSVATIDKYGDLYMYRLNHLIRIISDIRTFGTAALSLCYVAKGALDAYQSDGLYPWDAAAGVLIVREAGGVVKNPTGGEFDLTKPNFIAASSKKLLDDLVAVEKKADAERLAAESKNLQASSSKFLASTGTFHNFCGYQYLILLYICLFYYYLEC